MKKNKVKTKTYIEILKDDHVKVKALFKKFEKAVSNAAKYAIVKTVLKELIIHTTAEEEIVYPQLRKVIKQDLMDEADVEHDVAKSLIEELRTIKPDADHYDAKVTVLGEIIDHHVEEEEESIFPQAKKKIKDAETITLSLIARKKVLMREVKV